MTLGSSFPHPTPEDTADAARQLAQLSKQCPVIIDGLALGALDPAALSHLIAPLVALIHHPLAYESGLEPRRVEQLFQTERDNLRRAGHVIVPSPHTAGLLTDHYGVPAERITIARPGTDHPRVAGGRVDPPLILSVGSQVRRKGHDVLLEALHRIAHLPWQAVIAGSAGDLAYGATLEQMRNSAGLADRVRLAGPVSDRELAELYRLASVFALATRFEGYGMVFDEAMAHGLPIVTCDTGAVPDTVAPGAGVLVPVDDPDGFGRVQHTGRSYRIAI
jgi:glycosyltransferase involved in cell wall biosynthesis